MLVLIYESTVLEHLLLVAIGEDFGGGLEGGFLDGEFLDAAEKLQLLAFVEVALGAEGVLAEGGLEGDKVIAVEF